MASGFLYSIKAIVDKASFSEGLGELQKLEQTSKRIAAGIAGVAAAAVSSAAIAGEVATQELKVANAIGVSSEALSSWKIAANIAGASASGLIGQLVSLESKMQHLKTGSVDANLAKNLGLMGIGYGDFADMDSESRMKAVFNQANGMEDQELAATLVGDILGQAGQDYYQSLKMSGKSINQQLEEAKKLNFVSNQNRKEAALFASEVKSIKEAGKSITMLFGSEMAAALTPTVKLVKNYLISNREQIRRGIQGFAQNIGSVFYAIAGIMEKAAPIITGLIDKFGGLDQIIIKVGIGIASMKLVQVAGGIMSIVKSVNLLKAGLGGLVAGGLFLIIDDIVGHFQGKRSFLFDELPGLFKKLKETLKLELDIDVDKTLKGLKDLADVLVKFTTSSIKTSLELLKDFGSIIKDLFTGNWDELGNDIKKFFKDWKDGILELFKISTGEGTDSGGFLGGLKGVYEGVTGKEATAGNVIKSAGKMFIPGIGIVEYIKDAGGKKEGQKLKDGIIQPGGKVTSVSPDDWVFAVKDIADLAGALLPSGISSSSVTNEGASYVINQNLSVSGNASPQTVKQMAYRGTSEALNQNIRNASQRMQMSPMTR